jgi:hypothetical protein
MFGDGNTTAVEAVVEDEDMTFDIFKLRVAILSL